MVTEFIKSLLTSTAAIKGVSMIKFKASLKIGLFLAPGFVLIDKINLWAIQNSSYVAIVLSAIAIDHILGSVRHSRLFDNDFEWRENVKGLFTKLFLVVCVGILFEEVHHLAEPYKFVTEYTITITRITVFFYPFSSAIGNSRRISGGKFPPKGIEDRINKWMDSLNQN